METTEWMLSVRILIGFTIFLTYKNSRRVMLSRHQFRVLEGKSSLSSIFMVMVTKRVVFSLEISSITLDCSAKVFYSPNTYHLFVTLLSLNLAISAKNRWLPRIKTKISQKKDVLEQLCIGGPILHIAILFKQDSIRMLKLMKKGYKGMDKNSIARKYTWKLAQR